MVFSFPEAPLRLVSVSIICPNPVLSTVPVVHPLSGAHARMYDPGDQRELRAGQMDAPLRTS